LLLRFLTVLQIKWGGSVFCQKIAASCPPISKAKAMTYKAKDLTPMAKASMPKAKAFWSLGPGQGQGLTSLTVAISDQLP